MEIIQKNIRKLNWRTILDINELIGTGLVLYYMYENPVTWALYPIKYLVAILSSYKIIFTVKDKDFYKPENVGLIWMNSKIYVYM